jgi:hypothetical protein
MSSSNDIWDRERKLYSPSSVPPTNIMIQIREAGKNPRLQADHSMEADGTVKLLWELPTVRGEWDPNM